MDKKTRAIQIAKKLTVMYPDVRVFLNHKNALQLLIAVMLSAQCTDKKVNEVTKKLFKKYKTIDDYYRVGKTQKGVHEFEMDIKETGFYKAKAKHILKAITIIKEQFNGKVPKTMNELILLPGVGRKTANIVLESAFNIIEGIPVDTHVFRVVRRLGLSSAKTPSAVERDLCSILPREYWPGISYRIISYGREYCTARKHNHALCPLSKFEL